MFLMYLLLLPLLLLAGLVVGLWRLWPRTKSHKLSFGTAYRLTLHASTLPLIVFTFLSFLGPVASPLIFVFLILGVIALNFYHFQLTD